MRGRFLQTPGHMPLHHPWACPHPHRGSHRGHSHVTAPGRGCHGNGSWGCSGADGCVSTRVPSAGHATLLLPGGPGVLSPLEGAEFSNPRSSDSSDCPSPRSPERQACPLTPHLHVRTQPLVTKGHGPPLRGCRIRVQGAFHQGPGRFSTLKSLNPEERNFPSRCSGDLQSAHYPSREPDDVMRLPATV